jgi:hypothetical protein
MAYLIAESEQAIEDILDLLRAQGGEDVELDQDPSKQN